MPGYRRSRALWDEANRPDAPKMALLRAILYELQPIHFRKINTTQWRARWYSLIRFGKETLPSTTVNVVKYISHLSFKSWMMVAGVLVYYVAIRIIHELLDAGPIVMIITALIAIFTFGLSDNESGNGLSAYSVFNRGFQRLMGSVDVENLVQQHVGGGMAAGMAAMQQQPPQRNHHHHRDDDDDDMQPRARRAPARNNNNQRDNPRNDDDDDDDDDDAPELDNDINNQNNDINNRARKSGKKSRRRDLQQRRDLQEQRRAAVEMGLGHNDADTDVVVQRLIEEQLAAENNNAAAR
eukprot:CAMPEP_0119006472 /NCGR_PEP_ID=MMETSP1176-20130426/2310_1 /TAXON_ID=265551 /ORGANISM="Synedropsis recta cf, Strain CCMP1620" /LENGTH=295 /DNA_ID=CAMNT_0006958385 /DNA_START=69 /DNA_END=956 /DNA_ORIENTATION=-